MSDPYAGPAYFIRTSRLVLRCYQPADAPLLMAAGAESKEHLLPWMPWAKDYPISLERAIERMRFYRGSFDLGQDYVFERNV